MTLPFPLLDIDALLRVPVTSTSPAFDAALIDKPEANPFANPALDIFVKSPVTDQSACIAPECFFDAFLETPPPDNDGSMIASRACKVTHILPGACEVQARPLHSATPSKLPFTPAVTPADFSLCSAISPSPPHSPQPSSSTAPLKRRRKSPRPASAAAAADDRRRRNRESSSRCYYKRKLRIEARGEELVQARRYAVVLYARELELRRENARLKKEIVMAGGLLPRRVL